MILLNLLTNYSLGTHNKSSKIAVRGELGRYPLLLNIISKAIKFYWHIENDLPKDSLASHCLLEQKTMKGNHTWWNSINNICSKFGINFQRNIPLITIKKIMKQKYMQEWKKQLYLDKRLRTYRIFKNHFTYEKYLDSISKVEERKILTRLRISTHNLMIEKGRHFNIPLEERICKKCNCNKIEDEVHFVTECSHYHIERVKFFESVSHLVPNFSTLDNNSKFIYLMTVENKISKLFAKFLGILDRKDKSSDY